VQWQGLFLADEMKRLGKYDRSLDWSRIGTGLTNAGIALVNDKNQPGRFPDFLDLYRQDATIYNIWGNLVAYTMLTDLGKDPGISFLKQDDLHIASGYRILSLEHRDEGDLLTIDVPEGMPCYLVIRGTASEPIRIGHEEAVLLNDLTSATAGYRYDDSGGALVIKATGGSTPVRIVLSPAVESGR
jgi:hypothetical protein